MENIYTQAEISRMTTGEFSRNYSPVTSFVYVQSADEDGVDYVVGSVGKIKEIREYSDTSKLYLKTVSILKYQDALFPTQVTEVAVV